MRTDLTRQTYETWGDLLEYMDVDYDIDVDDRDPQYVYGGTQDNGTWGVPVRTYNGVGITNADVINPDLLAFIKS